MNYEKPIIVDAGTSEGIYLQSGDTDSTKCSSIYMKGVFQSPTNNSIVDGYKKTPWCGDHKGKSKKRIANHHVRNWFKRNPDAILPPGAYKKIYCSWDICDYGWIHTWEDYWNDCQE